MHSTNFYRDRSDDVGPHSHAEAMERHMRLASIAPLDAVRAWLTGTFGMGDEAALCASIRRDPDIDLDDDEIFSVFFEVLGEGDWRADKAEAVLTLLRGAAQFRMLQPKAPRR